MAADPADALTERYEIERTHSGAMGRLFIVRDRQTGERLAAKTIREDLGGDQLAQRFQVEARAWMALGQHPSIAEARFFREIGGHPFLFLEFVDGMDLERLLAVTGPLHLTQAVEFAVALFAGLAHAHGAHVREGLTGVVHRDLKPANLLVRRDRVLKITDWGLVKVLGGTKHTQSGQMLGTLAYAAPEQLKDASTVDARADLFAAGSILFEMLAGQRAFPGDQPGQVLKAILLDAAPRLSTFVASCPKFLSDLVGDCLEKDPERRPASAAEALARLEAVVIPAGPSATCSRCGLRTVRALPSCPLCAPWAPPPGSRGADRPDDEHLGLRLTRTVSVEGMVEVPAGAFRFGSDDALRTLGAFWIDRTPVTNRQFRTFVDEASYRPEEPRDFLKHWRSGAPPMALLDHPVVWVNLLDAATYAEWAGKVLPTWEQWERAARGSEGSSYPWGGAFEAKRTNTKEGGSGSTTPVERFPQGASPVGCLDMAGNVFQWTASWREPEERRTKVVCGGSWAALLAPQGLRRVRNLFPAARDFQTGFRCALDASA